MTLLQALNIPGARPFCRTAGQLTAIRLFPAHCRKSGLTVTGTCRRRPSVLTARSGPSNHGPRGGGELNRPEAGKNHGWPLITCGEDYSGRSIGDGVTAKDGMEQPLYHWNPVIAPIGLAFYVAWMLLLSIEASSPIILARNF
ncbi:PQQ-dependent sugar dehydrogenase [Roseibium aggregatum]|uniref:PQQ-dependent sugar dehydrogenase n=1 Tax=Roseibium aggregatum TaxID=187304 RepID=UPI002E2BAC7F|nr:PQQ-dependent sugar dehydrogenase [Roseibium aggregatum]